MQALPESKRESYESSDSLAPWNRGLAYDTQVAYAVTSDSKRQIQADKFLQFQLGGQEIDECIIFSRESLPPDCPAGDLQEATSI